MLGLLGSSCYIQSRKMNIINIKANNLTSSIDALVFGWKSYSGVVLFSVGQSGHMDQKLKISNPLLKPSTNPFPGFEKKDVSKYVK